MHEVDEQATIWDRWAPYYDGDSTGWDTDQAAHVLALYASGGPALELGVGTGRLALELARRGIPVVGIDASPQMIARLEQQRDGLPVAARLGDMADLTPVAAEGPFPLVYVAASTLFLLLTPQRQADCFVGVAKLLGAGGRFVVEAAVPGASDLTGPARELLVREVGADMVKITAMVRDPVAQIVRSQEIRFSSDGGLVMLPCAKRYASPGELDLMAAAAGLRLVDRLADWHGRPLDSSSRRHVSVYTAA